MSKPVISTKDAEHVRREFDKAAKDAAPLPPANQLTEAEQALLRSILGLPPDARYAVLAQAPRTELWGPSRTTLPSRNTLARLAAGHKGLAYNVAAVRAWLAQVKP